jgi:hypothetical protein
MDRDYSHLGVPRVLKILNLITTKSATRKLVRQKMEMDRTKYFAVPSVLKISTAWTTKLDMSAIAVTLSTTFVPNVIYDVPPLMDFVVIYNGTRKRP